MLACAPAVGQRVHPEFAAPSGSTVRAAMLYPDGPAHLARTFSNLSAYDRPNDPWLAFDKAEHVAFGFLMTLGSQYILVNKLEATEHGALPISVGLAASAGVAKELYDRRHGSGLFSTRDLIADAAGIVLAIGVILL